MGKRVCIHNVKRFRPGDKVKVVCFPDKFGFRVGDYILSGDIKGFQNTFTECMWKDLKKGEVLTVLYSGNNGLYFEDDTCYGWPSFMFDKVKG